MSIACPLSQRWSFHPVGLLAASLLCAPAQSQVRADALQEARSEGRVLVYGTVEPDEFAGWQRAFERKYPGIEVEFKRKYVPGTPPPMAKEIMEEAAMGKETADAVIVAVPPLLQFRDLNLLDNITPKEASAYPRQAHNPGEPWFPLVSLPMIQVYNPKMLSKSELPKTALDLTGRQWREVLATHDLSLGTLGAYWLASLRPILDEVRWKELVEGLAENKVKAFPLYDNVLDSVASGETKIGLTVLLHDYLKAKNANRDIERLKLSDVPIMATFNAIAKTRFSRHPAATSLLIDFLLSKEGQKLIGSTYLRIPAREGTGAPYALETILPSREVMIGFPNRAMLESASESIAWMAYLFAPKI